MQIMFTDETNQQPSRDGRFFVYGGLLFPVENLGVIHEDIERIRDDAGYRPTDVLKFDTRSRPDRVSRQQATEAKQRIIALCSDLGCKFIVHIILHDIIRNQDPVQQVRWAADYVIGRYNQYLEEIDDVGVCIVDNLPNGTEFQYLVDKFTVGLNLPDHRSASLDRIKLFASTRIGASHAHSAMDIVLGSFRYVINNPRNLDAASAMIKQVAKMMWAHERNGVRYIRERGLIIRPPLDSIRSSRYRTEYEDLLKRLDELTNN